MQTKFFGSVLFGLAMLAVVSRGVLAERLKVCATVPDLGNLVQEVGGDQVSVTVFGRGQENPHFIEAKPSFIKATSEADLFVQLGLEMEVGYVPPILANARNGRVLVNGTGFLDASKAIEPLEVPTGPIDRSMGDVHSTGNPHYLTDPLNGLKVAALLRNKLTELRPEKKEYFTGRYDDFRKRMAKAMVGDKLAEKYEFEKLALLAEHGKLTDFLKSQKAEPLLGGWLGTMTQYYGTKFADEHSLWPYLARRFGLQCVGHMEPVAGVSPTTKHIGALVAKMKAEEVPLILHAAYYDMKHSKLVAGSTGAKIVSVAHQVGAVKGTDDYLKMVDLNVRAIAEALRQR
jgi:ABC-type Zn uptake system ZnuABC Zn-binding protein ZnuA